MIHGCFCASSAEMSSGNRDHMTSNPKIFTICNCLILFCEKSASRIPILKPVQLKSLSVVPVVQSITLAPGSRKIRIWWEAKTYLLKCLGASPHLNSIPFTSPASFSNDPSRSFCVNFLLLMQQVTKKKKKPHKTSQIEYIIVLEVRSLTWVSLG